jgi:hypothetical protein
MGQEQLKRFPPLYGNWDTAGIRIRLAYGFNNFYCTVGPSKKPEFIERFLIKEQLEWREKTKGSREPRSPLPFFLSGGSSCI